MSSRRGVALVMAIVILAALLLLGLPFLFSQSAGLTGTRAFAHGQSAHVGRDTAENAAIAAVIDAMTPHVRVATPALPAAWSDLGKDLEAIHASPGAVVIDAAADRIGLDLPKLTPPFVNTTPGDTVLGVHIEDESGKLDPNFLSTPAWDALLKRCGIDDWDDDQTVNSKCVQVQTPAPPHYVQWKDDDSYGELAKALAELRLKLPGRRITRLEQLLLADTGHWVNDTGGFSYPTSAPYLTAPPTQRFGLRKPLTRAELEVLRPYLTLHEPAQARAGLIDLGSLVKSDSVAGGSLNYFLDGPVDPLIGIGTWLSSEKTDVRRSTWPDDPNGTLRQGVIAGAGIGLRLDLANGLTKFADDNDGIALQAPPALNLNAASLKTRFAAGNITAPGWPQPIRTYAGLKPIGAQLPDGTTTVEAYAFLDPLAQRYYPTGSDLVRAERPPLGIAGFGVITIEAAASARDPRGAHAAQQYRRVVAQALPQEEPIEARWYTQGALHALVASRSESALASWPLATERVSDLAADDPDLSTGGTPAPLTGLAPATQPSYATGWLERTSPAGPQQGKPRDVKIDWRLPLGADVPATQATVFNAKWTSASGGTGTAAPVINGVSITSLRPDGVKIAMASGAPAASQLAYPMAITDSDGPLRVIGDGTDHTNEIRSRHVGLWVRFEASPAGQVCLAEARMPVGNAGWLADDGSGVAKKGSNDNENLWRLQYDGGSQSFELVLANGCIEHATAYPTDLAPLKAPMDDPGTYDVDERSLGGDPANTTWITSTPSTAVPMALSPKDPIQRIVYRYHQGPIEPKRWYHVEACVASDSPGGHSLIVDGVVGRDVGTAAVAAAGDGWTKVGDHATIPSLRLVSAVLHAPPAAVAPAVLPTADITTIGGNALLVDRIVVRPPTGFTLDQLLPARGVVRIDDEYLTYEALDVPGNALLYCRRGERSNTYMGNANQQLSWPVIQEHLVDALVLPGGYQYTSNATTFYHGKATTTQDVGCGDEGTSYTDHQGAAQTYAPLGTMNGAATPANLRFRNWAYINVASLSPPGSIPTTTATLTLKPPIKGALPARGFILIRTSDGKEHLVYYGSNASGTLGALDFGMTTPGVGNDALTFDPVNGYAYAVLLSVEVDATGTGDVSNPFLFPANGAFQIAGGDGRIEWIRYTDTKVIAGSGYFIHAEGFPFLNKQPDASARGSQRTIFGYDEFLVDVPNRAPLASRTFPTGSVILPVHADVNSDNFIPGDVVTIIPRNLTGKRPHQMVIRFAANDGYPLNPSDGTLAMGGGRWDTKNEWYAFTDRVPDDVPDAPMPPPSPPAPPSPPGRTYVPSLLFVVGRGWTGADLSTVGNDPGRRRAILPRMDSWYEDYDTTKTGTAAPYWVLGAPDAGRGGVDTRSGVSIVADGVAAGDTDGTPDGNAADGCRALCFYDVGGTVKKYELLTGLARLPIDVECSDDVFVRPNPTAPNLGLVLLDGEVFAYRRDPVPAGSNPNKRATLIARALLGSDQNIHRMTPSLTVPNRSQPVFGGLPIIPLPVGPVMEINQAVTDQQWFTFQQTKVDPVASPTAGPGLEFDAPYALLTSLDGVEREVVALHGPWKYWDSTTGTTYTKYITAPWTRGLYNTVVAPTWSGTPAQPVLAIGWWPRFASALPKSGASMGRWAQQYFRSRTYAWAGFPLSIHGAVFDGSRFPAPPAPATTPPVWQMRLLELPMDASGVRALQQVEARALPGGFDWTASAVATYTATGLMDDPAKNDAAFRLSGVPDFSKPVDGAELRLTWHYVDARSSDWADLARAGGIAPMLGEVALRAMATARVLAVEDAR